MLLLLLLNCLKTPSEIRLVDALEWLVSLLHGDSDPAALSLAPPTFPSTQYDVRRVDQAAAAPEEPPLTEIEELHLAACKSKTLTLIPTNGLLCSHPSHCHAHAGQNARSRPLLFLASDWCVHILTLWPNVTSLGARGEQLYNDPETGYSVFTEVAH